MHIIAKIIKKYSSDLECGYQRSNGPLKDKKSSDVKHRLNILLNKKTFAFEYHSLFVHKGVKKVK